MDIKNVKGALANPTITGKYGPNASGINETSVFAIASIIPVPDILPVKIPAAIKIEITATTLLA